MRFRFERALTDARRLPAEERREQLVRALELWRGPVLTEFAFRERVDRSMQLQENRPPLKIELRRIRVRDVDRARRRTRRPMPEAPAVRARRDVGDDVELLISLFECTLEREVVVRRDDELVRRASLAEQRGQPSKEAMEGARLDGGFEPRVQLVVERPRPLHRRDVLGDAREIDRAIVRYLEGPGEMLSEITRPVETDHGHDPTREKGFDDLSLLVRRRRVVGHTQAGLVPQDLRLDLLELGAGLDPELVDEAGACILVHLQGLGLPARTIQREHQLSAEGLSERMLGDEGFELADHIALASELEVGVDPLAADDEPQLLEASDLCLREVVECELGQSGTAPEVEGGLKPVASLFRGKSPCVRERTLEASRIDLIRLHPEQVARRAGDEDVCAQRATQASDRVLERCGRGLRRLLTPQQVDQAVGCDDVSGVEHEDGEEPALLRTAERDVPGLV